MLSAERISSQRKRSNFLQEIMGNLVKENKSVKTWLNQHSDSEKDPFQFFVRSLPFHYMEGWTRKQRPSPKLSYKKAEQEEKLRKFLEWGRQKMRELFPEMYQ